MTRVRPDEAAGAFPSQGELEAALGRLGELALTHAARGGDAPAFARPVPGALEALARAPSLQGRSLGEALEQLLGGLAVGMDTGHRRFFAFVPSPASPASWIGEFAASIFNRHAGAALQGEGVAAIERGLVRVLCDAAGLPHGSGGLFVSGGSTANLAGLCLARDARLAEDERARAVVYLTTETHGSVAKALRIIGFHDRQIRMVAVDAAQRMDVSALAAAVAADVAAGRTPFAAVASAGTTATGAVDPLPEIADLCARERLWLHVDGAYGASALLSPVHRGLLAGIERADSLAWDAHKWLFQTYGCGALLVRDAALLPKSFGLTADYLADGAPEGVEPNFWDMGPELTRPARAARLWLTLQTMGLDGVGAAIGRGVELAEAAEAIVRKTPGWVVASPARLAITAFRFAPKGLAPERADEVVAAAARRLMEDGFAVVGTTRIAGRLAIRLCTLHPETSQADLADTIARLDAIVRDLAR